MLTSGVFDRSVIHNPQWSWFWGGRPVILPVFGGRPLIDNEGVEWTYRENTGGAITFSPDVGGRGAKITNNAGWKRVIGSTRGQTRPCTIMACGVSRNQSEDGYFFTLEDESAVFNSALGLLKEYPNHYLSAERRQGTSAYIQGPIRTGEVVLLTLVDTSDSQGDFWVNGTYVGQDTSIAMQVANHDMLQVGCRGGSVSPVYALNDAGIYWVGWWPRAWTVEEIQRLAMSPLAPFQRQAVLPVLVPAPPPPADSQYFRPISDVDAGTWSASTGNDLYAMIDEETADDGDYIYSTTSPSSQSCTVQLNAGNLPQVTGAGVRVIVRHKRN